VSQSRSVRETSILMGQRETGPQHPTRKEEREKEGVTAVVSFWEVMISCPALHDPQDWSTFAKKDRLEKRSISQVKKGGSAGPKWAKKKKGGSRGIFSGLKNLAWIRVSRDTGHQKKRHVRNLANWGDKMARRPSAALALVRRSGGEDPRLSAMGKGVTRGYKKKNGRRRLEREWRGHAVRKCARNFSSTLQILTSQKTAGPSQRMWWQRRDH